MALLTGDEVIEIATQLEERGEAFYSAASAAATTVSISSLFADLAEQEISHRRAFERMGRDVVELVLSPEQWHDFQAYSNALLEQSFFSKPAGALVQAAQAMDERQAIEAALDFEKETLLFFHELSDAVRGAGRETVRRIINEERQHIQRLTAMLSAVLTE